MTTSKMRHSLSIYTLLLFSLCFSLCYSRIVIDPTSCQNWMGDVTTSVNSALGWARLTSTGLSSNSPISGAIQAAAGLVIDNNMDAAARLGRVGNLAPLVPTFDPAVLQPGDVVIFCDLSRFNAMTQDGTRVIDSISTGNIDLEQYKKCDGTVEPRVEAFTARMTLGNSNIQYRPDFITLCPWYLQDLRNNGEFHISQNLVQQAIDFPGGDINDPDIDALTSLDTTMLHEFTHTTLAGVTTDNPGYGWKNIRNNRASSGADNLAYLGQVAFMISQYSATVNANGDVVHT